MYPLNLREGKRESTRETGEGRGAGGRESKRKGKGRERVRGREGEKERSRPLVFHRCFCIIKNA